MTIASNKSKRSSPPAISGAGLAIFIHIYPVSARADVLEHTAAMLRGADDGTAVILLTLPAYF